MTRYLMIFWFIVYCLKHGVNPWWFFQLNAGYFNKKKGIFSKWDINSLILQRWRLKQQFDQPDFSPDSYPVFVKPEWGQNSYGIFRADSPGHLTLIRQVLREKSLPYLIQEAACETREFEIFYVRQADVPDRPGLLSITEVHNPNPFPINGVFNQDSSYQDRTEDFSPEQRELLWQHLSSIGRFRVARVGLKANSEQDLSEGRFHIVEINLFTPMPLNLLDPKITKPQKQRFLKDCAAQLAACSKVVSVQNTRQNIFFRKLKMHYKVKSKPVQMPKLANLSNKTLQSAPALEDVVPVQDLAPLLASKKQWIEEFPQL